MSLGHEGEDQALFVSRPVAVTKRGVGGKCRRPKKNHTLFTLTWNQIRDLDVQTSVCFL